jgi:transposase
MGPYSMDLRRRVAEAVDQKEGSLRQIARRFRVSVSFISRLLGLRRQTGSLAPRPHGGGRRPALDAPGLGRLRQLVREQPDATLDELAQRLGRGCSRMAVWRALRRLKITRKKKVLRANERDRPDVQQKRAAFQQELAALDPKRLVFVDECGTHTAMARTHGRAPRGERVYGSVPGHWESLTVIAAMRLGGVVAPFAFEGATDTAAFRTYVEGVLAPELRPGDVVVWDNLQPHKDQEVVRAVEQAGARVLPAPPWSPDLVPIEKMFSKVKGFLRTAAARTREVLVDAIGEGLRKVCPRDILGWFRSGGLATELGRRARRATKDLLDRLRQGSLCATHS